MTQNNLIAHPDLCSDPGFIYDCIVIGGGAAGLFYAAGDTGTQSPKQSGTGVRPAKLILEKTSRPGQKLLLSGNGMCNITHGGSIKEFVSKYGEHGGRIRGCLYRHNNLQLMGMLEDAGVPLETREDGKVFPQSHKAKDILDALRAKATRNGFHLVTKAEVTAISTASAISTSMSSGSANESDQSASHDDYRALTTLHLPDGTTLITRKLVIATGGASYPATGSDGSFFDVLRRDLGLDIVTPKPALAPVYVEQYPYAELSGISFPDVEVSCAGHTCRGAMLLTHRGFSGPAFLHLSQHAKAGDMLRINYLPNRNINEVYQQIKTDQPGNSRSIANYLASAFDFPKAFARKQLANPDRKLSSVGHKELENIAHLLMDRRHIISGTGGWNEAMVTAGGVALGQMDLKTMRLKTANPVRQDFDADSRITGEAFDFAADIRIIGEALDINGDTGGYNLQFAYSSAMAALE